MNRRLGLGEGKGNFTYKRTVHLCVINNTLFICCVSHSEALSAHREPVAQTGIINKYIFIPLHDSFNTCDCVLPVAAPGSQTAECTACL